MAAEINSQQSRVTKVTVIVFQNRTATYILPMAGQKKEAKLSSVVFLKTVDDESQAAFESRQGFPTSTPQSRSATLIPCFTNS